MPVEVTKKQHKVKKDNKLKGNKFRGQFFHQKLLALVERWFYIKRNRVIFAAHEQCIKMNAIKHMSRLSKWMPLNTEAGCQNECY